MRRCPELPPEVTIVEPTKEREIHYDEEGHPINMYETRPDLIPKE